MAIQTMSLIPPAATPDMVKHEIRRAAAENRAPRQLVTRGVQVERMRVEQQAYAASGLVASSAPSLTASGFIAPSSSSSNAGYFAPNVADRPMMPLFSETEAGQRAAAEERQRAATERLKKYAIYGAATTVILVGVFYFLAR